MCTYMCICACICICVCVCTEHRTHFLSENKKHVSMRFFPLLNPFTFFTQASNSPPLDSRQSVLCICESISILLGYVVHYQMESGVGEVEESKGGINGDGSRLDLG